MDRKRKVAIVAGVSALALIGARFLLPEPAEGPPAVATSPHPLRLAAATPLAGYDVASAAPDTGPSQVSTDPDLPNPDLPDPDPLAALDPCAITLDAFADAGAMIGLTLQAPCRADAPVELRHAGLTVRMETLATGSLFTSLPAMDAKGEVEAVFDDGTVAKAAVPVPDLHSLRRTAVLGKDSDNLDLNAFENGADYGQAGHRTVENGGVLVLGAPGATRAEVYTFPAATPARLTIEAPVTGATCGRTLQGTILTSQGGAVQSTDLTLAMPACDSLGGFVVLNNLPPETTLAAAD